MTAILRKAWQGYHFLFNELPDPRTKDWLFAAKPYETLTLLGLYLMFVLKWGPSFMKNRQPYNLEKLLIIYNGFQVIACLYLFINAIHLAWGWDYKWICEPVDFSNNPKALEIANCIYFYYALKLIDLLDTVFFVLRKKFNQVSFLHIYHHTGMVLLIWGAITYLPGGHGTLIGVINSFVHVVMYAYYLLTVAIPSIKNEIWIKKLVTQLQILQFFWCVVHMAIIVFKSDCEYPRWTSAIFLPQNLFMLVLFIDFYIKTYIKKPREQLRLQKEAERNSYKNNNTQMNSHGKTKLENGNIGANDKEVNNAKKYLKNDLNKPANTINNGVSSNKNNGDTRNNVNIHGNANETSTCVSGKCKMNCHKQYKNE